MKKYRRASALLLLCALSASAMTGKALAAPSPWLVRAGTSNVDPKSDNGTAAVGEVTVDSQIGPIISLSYFMTPQLAIDVLGALPFKHDVSVNDTQIATAKHLPPTLSLQYHLAPDAKLRPYLGLGVNYTMFMEESLDGPGRLKLDDSIGLAAEVGLDFALDAHWLIGLELRYLDIDTDASVDGTDIGKVHIDPLVYGLTLGYRF